MTVAVTIVILPERPWRIMTPEEYAALVLQGRHVVQKDYDGFGNVAVWLTGHTLTEQPK